MKIVMRRVYARMAEYREVITRAVTGKGRKFTQSKHTISPTHRPTSILGCWVINHKYDAKKVDDTVEVNGSYDINVWYSHTDNTKTEVVTETVSYKDVVRLRYKDENSTGDEHEVIARVLQQPNCLEANIAANESRVDVQVEREFLTEIIGETKITVEVHPDSLLDDEDWDVEEDEFEDLNPDFIVDGYEE